MERDELDRLYSRLDDYSLRAERGEVAVSGFLSPREQKFGSEHLSFAGRSFLVFGGYNGAERCRIYLVPEYMEGITHKELCEYGVDTEIEVIRIMGSGYKVLNHRDFLGSLLALGLERTVIGDIVVDDNGYGAYVFCDRKISDYILSACERIGNDKVRCTRAVLGEDFSVERRTAQVSDTISSPRLDCIVGALISVSREKAKEIVLNGYCEVDFDIEQKCDRMIRAESLISIRGHGKFRVLSIDEKTKKGRIRLLAEKFI
jgi:RNA-binding protein YlmH